jgi:hypothetical protein
LWIISYWYEYKENILFKIIFIGSKGEQVNVKLFLLPNGDYLGEFTPKKIGKEKQISLNA